MVRHQNQALRKLRSPSRQLPTGIWTPGHVLRAIDDNAESGESCIVVQNLHTDLHADGKRICHVQVAPDQAHV